MYLKIDRKFDSLRSNPPKQPVNTPGLFIFVNVQILNYVGTVVARNKFATPHRHIYHKTITQDEKHKSKISMKLLASTEHANDDLIITFLALIVACFFVKNF